MKTYATIALRVGLGPLVCALMSCALMSCASDSGDDDAQAPAMNAQPLTCMAGTMKACACLGQGMGMQQCNPQGNGYGACMGCPAPMMTPPMAGSGPVAGSAPAAMVDAGKTQAGSEAMPMAGSDGGTDAGTDSGSEPTPSAGAVPGVSCGVGLPVQCELETEKCCVRSLDVDSCIEASATCDCALQNCSVMEAHCDGPEDCADNEVCCGTLGGQAYSDFQCATQCDANGQQRVACHKDETECPSGLICANSQLLANVQICIDPATIEQ